MLSGPAASAWPRNVLPVQILNGASQVAQWSVTHLQHRTCRTCEFDSLVWEDPLEEDMATHSEGKLLGST